MYNRVATDFSFFSKSNTCFANKVFAFVFFLKLGQITYDSLCSLAEIELTIIDHGKWLIDVSFDLTARSINWRQAINQAQDLPF